MTILEKSEFIRVEDIVQLLVTSRMFNLLFKNISCLLIFGNGYFVIFLFTEPEDVAELVEANDTDDKVLSSEHLNDKLAEEVEKEAENISTTEEAISESVSAEQSEESLIKAE